MAKRALKIIVICSNQGRSRFFSTERTVTQERASCNLTHRNLRGLHILFLRDVLLGYHGWAEAELAEMVALAKRGHNVTAVIGRTPDARIPTSWMTDGLAIHDMVLPHGRSPLSIGEFVLFAFLQTALKAGSVDCMIMDPHLAPFLLPIVLIRRVTTHSPVLILRVPTNPVETGGLITTVYMKFLYQLSVRLGNVFFDKTLFISPMLRDYYRALSHVPSEKAGVWPTSVDLHVFDPNLYPDQTVEMLRKKLGVGNKVCLIYHGSLTRPRGIMELLKAMTLLKQGKQANVMLILVGYGPLREEIKRYIQSEGLHDTVILCDQLKRDEVAERIAMADVEVLPMPDHEWWRYQCFIKVLECLAMNKPLISYRLPAVEVIVGDMPVVYWLKGTEGRDIADGILGYLRTRGSLNPALGRKIASRYSAEVIAENLEADITERN